MFKAILELIASLVVLTVCWLWYRSSPAPAYEPITVAVGGILGLADSLRRFGALLRSKGGTQSIEDNPELDAQDEDIPESGECNEGNLSSTVFFYRRFSDAFPGVRGIKELSSTDGLSRLEILFRDPITFRNGTRIPIWWWRDGDLHISDFRKLNRKTILIDHQEFRLGRVFAVNSGSYYQCFVYLEVRPSKPTGLYNWTKQAINESVRTFGYAREEYALVDGRRKISREQYDDGSMIVWGKPRTLKGREVELRCRYITPYNVIIAPFHSPINNRDFRHELGDAMNSILSGDASLDDLVKRILALPKNETHI